MSVFNFNFSNTGTEEFNDIIYPGEPFILNNYSYKFIIEPKTPFWRFGIRLSKTEVINFSRVGNRHIKGDNEYRDIHLSIGERPKDQWGHPSTFHLAQYNFPDTAHLLSSENTYMPYSKIEFGIEYFADKNLLNVWYNGDSLINWGTQIFLEPEYKYFKVFAWADNLEFNLDCAFSISSLTESLSIDNNSTPFKLGNIIFRYGDMFDSYAQSNTNILLLPASTNGTITDSISDRILQLGIPKPIISDTSSVTIFTPKSRNYNKAGYAYAVEGRRSNEKIIENTCKNILNVINDAELGLKISPTVNLPLLGTGAGGIDPITVALLYDQIFNNNTNKIKLIVSIQNKPLFNLLKVRMFGRYISLADEKLQKPNQILDLELRFKVNIDYSAFDLNEKKEIIRLGLSHISISDFTFLKDFHSLEALSFFSCDIDDLSYLANLKNLYAFLAINSTIKDWNLLERIKGLTLLNVTSCKSVNSFGIKKLKNLTSLTFVDNNIADLSFLSEMVHLKFLDLSKNKIRDIEVLSKLKNLDQLILFQNQIANINPLVSLNKLIYLDISHNQIYFIESVLKIENLVTLKAEGNPFLSKENLILNELDNHLTAVKSILLRQFEEDKFEIILPAKILLLGNHASGKSSLLHYILNDNLKHKGTSTHIIKIEKYPSNLQKIPEAIFFDFGGQDYYHGIYRAFLSAGSAYLILWDEKTNKNDKRLDVNDFYTQDFTLQYWLCQKRFIEEEVIYSSEKDPVLIIQTHADKGKRISFHDSENTHDFENEFYLSLLPQSLPAKTGKDIVNEQALKYLKTSVLDLINRTQKKKQEPIWYIDFLTFILNETTTSNHECKSVSNFVLNKYDREDPDKITYLYEDLSQLHNQGLILYYNTDELHDVVWLNPVALVNHVHDYIITKELKSKYNGRVPVSVFNKNIQPELLSLLCIQKVIFPHEHGHNNEPEYIIPNFLPLIEEEQDFSLLTFDIQNPFFILKFRNFLPFGLINQLICFFGRQHDQKKFWRDTLLFTFNGKARILIHLDFKYLEIKVSGSFYSGLTENEKREIKTYLFYSIITLYWDSHTPLSIETFIPFYKSGLKIDDKLTLEQRDIFERCQDIYEAKECRPSDLYISLDDKDFVRYFDLCSEESDFMINAKIVNDARELLDSPKVISIYPFQLFVKKPLQKRHKVVISYSKKDLELVDKFRNYLAPLLQNGLIEEPWYCTELIAGREWNKEIETKFSEADIVFFMISDNLMSTKYVLENEIKNAIDRWDKGDLVKIVPILLVPYNFERANPYNLTRFTGLPYLLRPITQFKNQNLAWHLISECIKAMIVKDLFPDKESEPFNLEIKRIFEEIVKEKWEA